jgi:hypothetical protein
MQTFTTGSWLRWSLGAALLLSAVSVLVLARSIDWGVAWTLVVPALCAFFPALGLMQHRRLTWDGHHLRIHEGRLWRREWQLRLQGEVAVELLPTAGLYAVIIHLGEHDYPVAVWLGRRQAEALATWLDQSAPSNAWPRRHRAKHRWDR